MNHPENPYRFLRDVLALFDTVYVHKYKDPVEPLNQDTPEIRPPLKSGHPSIMQDTPEIRTPLKSGHLDKPFCHP